MATGLKLLGKITVTTAGTRVQLTTSDLLAKSVRIEADEDNTGTIYVGDLSVTNDLYAAALAAGDSFSISGPIVHLPSIFLDASIDAQAAQVSWL